MLLGNANTVKSLNFLYISIKFINIHLFSQISYKESINFFSKFLHEDLKSEGQTQEFQEILLFFNAKLGFHKLCDMIPLITQSSLKNQSASLLQKLIDNLLEKNYITKEEIHEFLNNKTQSLSTIKSSVFKESLDPIALNFYKKNSNRTMRKLKKKLSFEYISRLSNCSIYSGVLFEGGSSDENKYENYKDLYKIEEITLHNKSSVNLKILDKVFFRKNHHETFG